MNVTQLKDKEFSHYQKLIYDLAGINLAASKKQLVAGRLMKRLKYFNLTTYGDYLKIIEEVDQEKQIMIDLLTTNETFFFREKKHFEFLKEKIISFKDRIDTLRIWSAASSTGAEAYSIAMVLEETTGGYKWEVLGSDINEEVLMQARTAIYLKERTKEIPENYLKKYCRRGVRSHDGKILIVKALRHKVEFVKINLNDALPNIGKFDFVFLRNVLIYFDHDKKRTIVEKIIPVLKKEGLLIVGHSEGLHGITDKLITEVPTIYKRRFL